MSDIASIYNNLFYIDHAINKYIRIHKHWEWR